MHTFLQYEKQLRNLQLQEGRLRRQREKDMAELRQLQRDRAALEQQASETCTKPGAPGSLNGFEFSSAHTKYPAESIPPITKPQIETDRNSGGNRQHASFV